MREHLERMVEIVDRIGPSIDDWDYMQLMTLLQQAYMSTPVAQRAPTPHPAASHTTIEHDYYNLLSRHHRLKRANKRRFKAHREQIQNLQETVEELQHEISYLEQGQRPPLVMWDGKAVE